MRPGENKWEEGRSDSRRVEPKNSLPNSLPAGNWESPVRLAAEVLTRRKRRRRRGPQSSLNLAPKTVAPTNGYVGGRQIYLPDQRARRWQGRSDRRAPWSQSRVSEDIPFNRTLNLTPGVVDQ